MTTSFLKFFNEGKKEYVVWGIDAKKGKTYEEPLYTKAETYEDAKKVAKLLEKKYGIKNTRIQVIDFSEPIDFTKTVKI